MIYSMTAFARLASLQEWGSMVWEVRSVNHRYLEPHFKLPESMRVVETGLREKLRKTLSRGKIECSLRLQPGADTHAVEFSVDNQLLKQVIAAGETVQNQLQDASPINPIDLLKWPGVVTETLHDTEAISEQILDSFQTTLKQLVDSRAREGAVLREYIEQRLDSIQNITIAVRKQLPQILVAQRQKLTDRLQELKAELNTERLEQEMVILAQKADVDEELDRLDTHIGEVHRVLKKGGVCGRRLDFLMQELNREANTLSSKSIVSDTTQAAVELKVLIEQMREQIQNIE
jgi:uncharacterized protein (TIGR00255 family)